MPEPIVVTEYDREWPIWTYQEQLPPAKFVPDRHGRTSSQPSAADTT